MAEVALPECGSSPRREAKTPRPMKGKYIINSLSDALPDPISSDNIEAWNLHKCTKFKKKEINNLKLINFHQCDKDKVYFPMEARRPTHLPNQQFP